MPQLFGTTPTARPGFRWEYHPGQYSAGWQETPIPGYVPPTTPTAATAGTSPATTQAGTPFPSIPQFGLPDIQQITAAINQMQQQGFQQAEGSRIPGQAGLEAQSSGDIAALLNPGEYFPGTSRESAELSSLRGVAGSPAADSTWVRMTDEERLRRMGLGQQFLTAALGRHPIAPQYDPSGLANYLARLPAEQAQLLTQQQQFAASQQQQRDLALAQMQNAYNIAQLQALRAGRALAGHGGRPSYGATGRTTSGTGSTTPPVLPGPPSPRGEGSGTTFGIPISAIPDNWAQLTPEQQQEYAGLINANPYFGLPDWQNPYSGDETPREALGVPPGAPGAAPNFGSIDLFDPEDYFA